ncbi:MAG: SGNH/GDSL hydrolase family protein [Planctomycetota bacterium]
MNKRTMLIAYIVLLHLCLGALVARPVLRRLQRHRGGAAARVYRYEDRLRVHQRIDAAVPAGAVLCFGDSFTAGLCTLTFSKEAVNFGLGSDTVDDIRRRLGRYTSLERCAAVVLAAGFNDLLSEPADRTGERYRLLLQELPSEVPIVVCGVLPVDPGGRSRPDNAEIAALNRRIAELCAGEDRWHYLQPPRGLTDDTGALRRDVHDGDGVHLNAQGYAIWAAALRTALAEALGGSTDESSL